MLNAEKSTFFLAAFGNTQILASKCQVLIMKMWRSVPGQRCDTQFFLVDAYERRHTLSPVLKNKKTIPSLNTSGSRKGGTPHTCENCCHK